MPDIQNFDFEAGEVLLIDKPATWTSFDVVAKIRNTIKIKKVGHAGTLDPLATGLLIVCTGKMTKQIDGIQAGEKEYLADITFGGTTPSFDLETEVENKKPTDHLTKEAVEAALPRFLGEIDQFPPAFSAIWVNGKRAYEMARKGAEVEMQPRKVLISELEVVSFENTNRLILRIVCGKGTYIRSLANDLGQVLGVGGYLSGLTRTRIGAYKLQDAYKLTDFVELARRPKQSAE